MNKTKIEIIGLILLVGMALATMIYALNDNQKLSAASKKTEIKFRETELDLGLLEKDRPREVEFIFTNKGKAPLLIYEVDPSCGCTGVEWTRRPIAPGKKGKIKVSYDAKKTGIFMKSLMAYGNIEHGPVVLRIKGEVK